MTVVKKNIEVAVLTFTGRPIGGMCQINTPPLKYFNTPHTHTHSLHDATTPAKQTPESLSTAQCYQRKAGMVDTEEHNEQHSFLPAPTESPSRDSTCNICLI